MQNFRSLAFKLTELWSKLNKIGLMYLIEIGWFGMVGSYGANMGQMGVGEGVTCHMWSYGGHEDQMGL